MAEKMNPLLKAGSIAGAIVAVLSLYIMLQTGVKSVVTESSEQLTLEIKKNTQDLADLHRTDLHVRIRTLSREIEEIEKLPHPLSTDKALLLQRLKSQREDLTHQVEEVNEKWFAH